MRHVQKLSLSFFDRTPIGTLVSRITNDTEAIKDFYVSVLSTFVKNIVFLVGILVAMFFIKCKISAIFSRINSDHVCDYGIISPEKCSFLFRSP